MIDLHVHVWEHAAATSLRVRRDQLEAYCNMAASRGVATIAITEHLERFRQVRSVLDGAWADDPVPELRRFMDQVFEQEQGADPDEYVAGLLAAQEAGLPILVGIELGWWPDRVPALATILAEYPLDIVLGSVHNLGAWMFDAYDHPAVIKEWERRAADDIWEAYTRAVEDLAGLRVCDVLAHVDLVKVTGRRPAGEDRFCDRLADAAERNDLAVEVSAAGWRKPVHETYPAPDLLRKLHARGVPVTLASDAHRLTDVAADSADLRELVAAAGYDGVATFRGRTRRVIPLPYSG